MFVNDITITSIETITAFDTASGAYKFTLDELQNADIAQTQDSAEVTGKGGRKLNTLKRNKAVTISGTNGMISGGLLELQTGGEFERKATEVLWTDYLTVNSHAANTTWKAVGSEGAEIDSLYIRNPNGTLGAQLTQSNAVAQGKFTYNPDTKALAFNNDVADNTEIVVYYKRKITADTLDNKSDKYSTKCTLYVDAIGEDKCAKLYRIQFFIPKADFSGEFTLSMSDTQATHAFEAEALAGACGTGATLWTYTVFGEDTEDVTD